MKTTLIISFMYSIFWMPETLAYRSCQTECPVSFAPADPSRPLQDYTDRQNCLSRCQQDNAEQAEIEEQTDLLRKQQEKQEELENENEELRDRLDELESNI